MVAGKLATKGVDLMVANDVAAPESGFDHDTNAVTILEARGGCHRGAAHHQGGGGRRPSFG